MRTLYQALQWTHVVVWSALALLAMRHYFRRRSRAAAWLGATFGSFSLVLIGARIEEAVRGSEVDVVFTKALITILVLFPYFLYRFMLEFAPRNRALWIVAHLLTAVVVGTTWILPDLPQAGEPRPAFVQAFVALLLLQWTTLTALVFTRLWSAARGQPSVARKRMRTLALGAAVVAVVLLFAGAAPQPRASAGSIVTQAVTLLAGPLFLIGFAPPQSLIARWRRNEARELRDAEVDLVRATTTSDVLEGLLPRLSSLIGGKGAALIGLSEEPIAVFGLEEDEIRQIIDQLPAHRTPYEPFEIANGHVLRLEAGWLVVRTTAFTAYFGEEELAILQSLALLLDLALVRAEAYEKQNQATAAMQDFVAIASHDLRTPVTVVEGLTQSLQTRWDEFDDAEKQQFIASVARQTEQLKRLISDLLMVSTIDIGGLHPRFENVDVGRLTSEVANTLVSEGDLSLEVEPNSQVVADPDHVRRILENYIRNAIVYGSPPIHVLVRRDGGSVSVHVEDHGPGVPPDLEDRLFEKFARADRKKSKATQGTGLGLSIVRGLARANGGDAWYERGQGGAGAVFVVTLPASQSPALGGD